MTVRESSPLGSPIWVELFTSVPDTAQAFYTSLFGWTCEDQGAEYGGYLMFFKDGQQVAGGMNNDGSSGAPDGWSTYLAIDDAQAVADAATANGGMVMMPPMQVMELGTMVIVGDPGGAAIGGWKPGEHKGFMLSGEPGAPSWFELLTRDFNASVAFYENVFHWPVEMASDTPEFRYATYGTGDAQQAGIMDATSLLGAGEPARWLVYFGVESADRAIVRAGELGGSVVTAAEDTPYGRLAEIADPTGVTFKIVEPLAG